MEFPKTRRSLIESLIERYNPLVEEPFRNKNLRLFKESYQQAIIDGVRCSARGQLDEDEVKMVAYDLISQLFTCTEVKRAAPADNPPRHPDTGNERRSLRPPMILTYTYDPEKGGFSKWLAARIIYFVREARRQKYKQREKLKEVPIELPIGENGMTLDAVLAEIPQNDGAGDSTEQIIDKSLRREVFKILAQQKSVEETRLFLEYQLVKTLPKDERGAFYDAIARRQGITRQNLRVQISKTRESVEEIYEKLGKGAFVTED